MTVDADGLTTLNDVVGLIYECTLDPAQWTAALHAISSFIGGNRVRIFLFDSDSAIETGTRSFGVDRDFNVAFDRDAETLASIKYGFVIGELDKALTLSEILGVTDGRDVNGLLPYDNRFYREWMEPRGAHDAVAALVIKTPQRFGGMAMTRSAPLPPFGPLEKQKLSLLAPHVRRALTLSDLLEQRTIAHAGFSDVIDALATPIIVVSDSTAIVHANTAAVGYLNARDVVRSNAGALHFVAPEANRQFRAAVRDGLGGGPQTIILPRVDAPGLIATILPLGVRNTSSKNRLVAVFIHRTVNEAQLPGEAFAKLYKLTAAELRVVMLLINGASVAEIAGRLGSAPETVRWHLKNLRTKTGANKSSDLVRLAMQTISPVSSGESR